MSKQSVRVFVKYSIATCNKDLLDFLLSNIRAIKKRYDFKVIVVFDDMLSKIPSSIKKLPVMIKGDDITTGTTPIKEKIVRLLRNKSGSKQQNRDFGVSDLKDYWNVEMGSKDQEDQENNLMDDVKRKTAELTIQRQESMKSKTNRSKSSCNSLNKSSHRDDSIQLEHTHTEKISDMVSDPHIKKFWEGQEATPGF